MMLFQIEQAMKAQFTWAKNPIKKFQTNIRDERYASFGLLVFIGIAYAYGIEPNRIMDYACIESNEFNNKLETFEEIWLIVEKRKRLGNLYLNNDFNDRLYAKVKLTLNALNSQFAGKTPYCKLHL